MSRRSLDRAAVVREAAAIADREGWDALTFSVLASRLGVKPPSLYNHIESLDALRRALQLDGLERFAESAGEAAMGRSGREALERMGLALFALARTRPGVWAALQRAPEPGDEEVLEASRKALRPFEAVLEPMGLSPTESVHLLRALRALVQGFATLEAQGGFGLPASVEDSFRRALGRILPA